MKFGTVWLFALAIATPASAEWHKVESDHFVIYADDSPRDLEKFAQMLERYHAAMAYVTTKAPDLPSPSNRVTIYAVGSQEDIRQLAGTDSRYLQGFYVPRAGGSHAFVQDIRSLSNNPDRAMTTLLHEYAHHYLISTSRFAMPRWLSEGAAEFFASASFDTKGGVKIGRPAMHRADELFYAQDVSLRELLDEDLYAEKREKSERYDSFYGRSWLLYHYLTFAADRSGQFADYWLRLARGTAPLEAAEAAFGDLDQMEKDLDGYLRSRRMLHFDIDGQRIPIGPVRVTAVSHGLAEMMPVVIKSQRGVELEEAQALVLEARTIAARHNDDAEVLAALAEAEHDAENYQAAVDAADRALAIDASAKNALVQKGLAQFELAADADDLDAAYEKAFAPFVSLNKLEADHPIPLIYYYRRFLEVGREPPTTAKQAIQRASELAPFDLGLALQNGIMLANDGQVGMARRSLQPVAYAPHGGGGIAVARAYLKALEDAPEGEPVSVRNISVDQPEVTSD